MGGHQVVFHLVEVVCCQGAFLQVERIQQQQDHPGADDGDLVSVGWMEPPGPGDGKGSRMAVLKAAGGQVLPRESPASHRGTPEAEA